LELLSYSVPAADTPADAREFNSVVSNDVRVVLGAVHLWVVAIGCLR
jgi:hypothetical protein